MADYEWTVVGGSGKTKKTPSAKKTVSDAVDLKLKGSVCPSVQPGVLPPGWGAESTSASVGGVLTARAMEGVSSTSSSAGGRRRKNAPKTVEERVGVLVGRVRECMLEVERSSVFQAVKEAMRKVGGEPHTQQEPGMILERVSNGSTSCPWLWEEVEEVVCYGLGSMEDSRVSRYQLAFGLLLVSILPGNAPLLTFDPAFGEVDALLLAHLNVGLIKENEGCARRAVLKTLFYLPHLEGQLCNNLLLANTEAGLLSNVAIIGNKLSTYKERWSLPSKAVDPKCPRHMLELIEAGHVLEVGVPDGGFHELSAFNDMAMHVFSA
eukprot:gene1326-32683_t